MYNVIKDKVLRLHTTSFADVAFQVCTKVVILLIWRCLGIRYKVDIISRPAVLGGFATLVFLLNKGLNLSMK